MLMKNLCNVDHLSYSLVVYFEFFSLCLLLRVIMLLCQKKIFCHDCLDLVELLKVQLETKLEVVRMPTISRIKFVDDKKKMCLLM